MMMMTRFLSIYDLKSTYPWDWKIEALIMRQSPALETAEMKMFVYNTHQSISRSCRWQPEARLNEISSRCDRELARYAAPRRGYWILNNVSSVTCALAAGERDWRRPSCWMSIRETEGDSNIPSFVNSIVLFDQLYMRVA